MDRMMLNLTPFIRKYLFPLSLGFLGLILLGYGLIGSFTAKQKTADIVFTAGEESKKVSDDTSVKAAVSENIITVDVSGAVKDPGVYTLPEGSRVQDALKVAGGLSDEADTEFVARSFNLAAKLGDGSKVYIPKVGEGIGSTTSNVAGADGVYTTSNSGQSTSGLININRASAGELDTLSGVGPVTAGKIIDNRPYDSIDQLLTKKVVSNSVFEKIKEKVAVY